MEASLVVFREGISQLRNHIKTNDAILELIASIDETTCSTTISTSADIIKQRIHENPKRRAFEYNSVIISLYGFLEWFLENLAMDYLTALNNAIPEVADLPEKIKKNHLAQAADLMRRCSTPKYKRIIKIEDIVRNMYACITPDKPYRLTPQAYIYHGENFRFSSTNKFFSRIGLPNIAGRVKNSRTFAEFWELYNPITDLNVTTHTDAFYKLNDLAQRRNDVSHGTENVETLDSDILVEYLDFIEAFGVSAYELVLSTLLEFRVAHKAQGIQLVHRVINNSILCFRLPSGNIRVGHPIIVETGNPKLPFKRGRITGIQVNGRARKLVSAATNPIDVGVELDVRIKSTYNFYLDGSGGR